MQGDGGYKVIIAGGGTGGHLFPGIAVAEEFKKRIAGVEVIFIGTKRGIEAKVLPKMNYSLKFINVEGFLKKSIFRKMSSIFRLLPSFFNVHSFLKKAKPDLVIGTGGYTSFLPALVSSLMSIPTIILEQNAIPGMSNRIISKFAQMICATYESSLSYFPKRKTFLTGNPVQARVKGHDRMACLKRFFLKDGRFTILIFGGSSGARSLNRAVVESLPLLVDLKENIQFLHQTGGDDHADVRSEYIRHGFDGTVTPFIYQMSDAYCVADLIISRAGATTIAEITAAGIPSILIPYPHATAAHQEINASRLALSGAAVMIKEEKLSGQVLERVIKRLFLNSDDRERLKRRSMALGKPDATKRVVDIAMSISKMTP